MSEGKGKARWGGSGARFQRRDAPVCPRPTSAVCKLPLLNDPAAVATDSKTSEDAASTLRSTRAEKGPGPADALAVAVSVARPGLGADSAGGFGLAGGFLARAEVGAEVGAAAAAAAAAARLGEEDDVGGSGQSIVCGLARAVWATDLRT